MGKVARKLMERYTFIRSFTTTFVLFFLAGNGFARDPFWPLGYESRPVVTPVVDNTKPQILNQQVPLQKRVVNADDWAAARKLVTMTGFASAGGRQIAFMNGKSYRQGDKLTFTNDGILFTWRVDIMGERKVDLVQVEAVLQ
jgi:hypothetical protein